MGKIEGKLIFLGTGTSQGVPPIGCNHPVCQSTNNKDKRLRTSALVKVKEKNLVIDCGPDFRQQMLRENVNRLEAIVFTHEHNDHVSGLDDIRPFYYYQNNQPIPLYCPPIVAESIKERFGYFFYENKYPGVPDVDLHIVENKSFSIKDIDILPIEVQHGTSNIFGYRIGNLTYITDASHISGESLDKMKGCDVLVLNALRIEPKHPSHFTLAEAIDVVQKVKPKKAYFTHISHLLGFHDEVEAELPEGIHLAYDGLEVEFGY